ncbi:MAG: hypothetical protein ACTHU0_27875 [Kofleriaceae bacterium]
MICPRCSTEQAGPHSCIVAAIDRAAENGTAQVLDADGRVAARVFMLTKDDEGMHSNIPGCTCEHVTNDHGEDGCFYKNGHDIYCSCSAIPASIIEKRRARIVAARPCPTHRRYQAKRQPRAACEGCWGLWFAVNPKLAR